MICHHFKQEKLLPNTCIHLHTDAPTLRKSTSANIRLQMLQPSIISKIRPNATIMWI